MFKKLSLAATLLFSVSNVFGMTKASDPITKTTTANKNKVVAVIFVRPGCPYCPARKALFNQLKSYNTKVVYLEVSANPANKAYFKSAYGFPTFPTIVFFKNGKQVAKFVGNAIKLPQMKKTLDSLTR